MGHTWTFQHDNNSKHKALQKSEESEGSGVEHALPTYKQTCFKLSKNSQCHIILRVCKLVRRCLSVYLANKHRMMYLLHCVSANKKYSSNHALTWHHIVCKFSQKKCCNAGSWVTGIFLLSVHGIDEVAPRRQCHIATVFYAHKRQGSPAQLKDNQHQFRGRTLVQEQ